MQSPQGSFEAVNSYPRSTPRNSSPHAAPWNSASIPSKSLEGFKETVLTQKTYFYEKIVGKAHIDMD